MSKLFLVLLVIIRLAVPAFSQTEFDKCLEVSGISGHEDIKKSPGSDALLCWQVLNDTGIHFFRIYRSQTQAGAWDVWQKVIYDPATMKRTIPVVSSCSPNPIDTSITFGFFNFKADIIPRRYRIVAVYSVDEDGVPVVKESLSSSEVRISPIP